MTNTSTAPAPSREQPLHSLYKTAELAHSFMCTHLCAAFSLKHGEADVVALPEAKAVDRWRREIVSVAIKPPEPDGPLRLRGHNEVMSRTGRRVRRVSQARLCRCGGSQPQHFCNGTHGRNGFSAK